MQPRNTNNEGTSLLFVLQAAWGAEKLLFNVLDLLEQNGVENVIVAPELGSNGPTGLRKEYFVEFLEFHFPEHALRVDLKKLGTSESPPTDSSPGEAGCRSSAQSTEPVHLSRVPDERNPMVRNVHDPRLYCPTNWRLLPDKSLCPHAFGRACLTEGCVKPTLADARQLFATIFNRQLSFWKTTLIIESRETYAMALQNGYREEQLCLIPNCTPLPPLQEEMEEKASHANSGQNTLLFIGRASYEKGLHFLLNALPRVRNDFKLFILTAGDYYEKYRSPIQRLGLRSKVEVRFDTSYKDTAAFYSMADVVVVPSVWFEPFCMIGIEAYSHLTPVVATRTGGIKDWCVDGETGFLVDIFDEDALARRSTTCWITQP